MKKQLLLVSLLTVGTALGAVSCGGGDTPVTPEKSVTDYKGVAMCDDDVYNTVLGDYNAIIADAKTEANDSLRFAKYAKAEAQLLDSGVFMPTRTRGGTPGLSRVAYKSTPQVDWGLDADRIDSAIITKNAGSGDALGSKGFISQAVRDELKALRDSGAEHYTPATIKAKLEEHGYEVYALDGSDTNAVYCSTFSKAPANWDALGSSKAQDNDMSCQGLIGLFEYDRNGQIQPRMAVKNADDSMYTIGTDSDGCTTYTFKIRQGISWQSATGSAPGKQVTADDFVSGFHHMLDTACGLDWLVNGVIKGVDTYLETKTAFDTTVGVKAVGDDKLVYTLAKDAVAPYFPTMLTYSIFLPMNKELFEANGGKWGNEWTTAKGTDACTWGKAYDKVYYNGAFIPTSSTDEEIKFKRNDSLPNDCADWISTNANTVKYVKDAGSDPIATYDRAIEGTSVGVNITAALVDKAKNDNLYGGVSEDGSSVDWKFARQSETEAVTYLGGVNVHRQTYVLTDGDAKSPKSYDQAVQTSYALLNKNFRKAIDHAIDRITWNTVSSGTGFGAANLRNLYTKPDFVQTSEAVTYNGHTWAAGTSYVDMVQSFVDDLGNGKPDASGNSTSEFTDLSDGQDGWYNVDLAQYYLAKAVAEVPDLFTEAVQIDIAVDGTSEPAKNQATILKNSVEAALNTTDKKYVQINIVECRNSDNYQACGYSQDYGKDDNYDYDLGTGWAPDFGDPVSYLDTFAKTDGYMNKILGMY